MGAGPSSWLTWRTIDSQTNRYKHNYYKKTQLSLTNYATLLCKQLLLTCLVEHNSSSLVFTARRYGKRRLCCHPVSVCHVGALYSDDIVFIGPVPHHSSFVTPIADAQFQGELPQRGRKILGWEKFAIAVYLGNSTR